jgi:hypothetical protein
VSHATPPVVRWHGAVALAAVVAVTAGLAQTSVGHAVLKQVGLYHESQPITSLAFLHPESLPEQLSSPRANVDISFEIDNLTSATSTYSWSVLLVHGTDTSSVDTGRTSVAPGHGASITRAVQVACRTGQVEIIVSLASPRESIDATMACWSPGSGST